MTPNKNTHSLKQRYRKENGIAAMRSVFISLRIYIEYQVVTFLTMHFPKHDILPQSTSLSSEKINSTGYRRSGRFFFGKFKDFESTLPA